MTSHLRKHRSFLQYYSFHTLMVAKCHRFKSSGLFIKGLSSEQRNYDYTSQETQSFKGAVLGLVYFHDLINIKLQKYKANFLWILFIYRKFLEWNFHKKINIKIGINSNALNLYGIFVYNVYKLNGFVDIIFNNKNKLVTNNTKDPPKLQTWVAI